MNADAGRARQVVLGPYTVELSVGDVAEAAGRLPVVSSDDNYLSHGGGVSAAIWRAVGGMLKSDPAVVAVRERGERPGLAQVLVSRVGPERVPVFHAITIDFDLGERLSPQDLGMLYTNLLQAADEAEAEQVVLPLIGAGAGHVSASGTVTALLDVVRSRSLLSSGQRLSVWALPGSLPEARESFDRWLERNPSALKRASGPATWMGADLVGGAIGGILGLEGGLTHELMSPAGASRGLREHPAHTPPARPGRWEALASAQSRGEAIVEAARELDLAPNAKASGPAMRLWGLLDSEKAPRDEYPPDLQHVLELARSARNRLAHGTGDQTALLPDLIRGIEVLLDPAPAQAIEQSATILVGGVRADWTHDGTQHVRLLHDLLRTSLTVGQIEAESERLGALGYRGEPSDRLLENCVTDDPIDVLQRHFSGSDLRRLLAEREIPERPSDPPRELARKLLHHLGFPRRDELVDPDLVRRDVLVLASELHALSEPQLTGRIAGISRSLEAVLRTYLRFLTKGLLETSPDIWLEQRRQAKQGARLPQSVDRATFGQLARLVGAAGKQINKSTDPRTQARVQDLRDQSGQVQWLPGDILALVEERNVWVHGATDDGDVMALSVAEKRRQAREFCDLAQRILDALIDGPFPSVIVIEEIGYDNWGRRHVRARTSKGTVESLFTDLELIPGQTYLMHARTNPLRVDPLLVRQAVAFDEGDL